MNHVISLEDILGPELAIQAAQDKQFKRLNAIQAGLEAGIPFDMPALAAELGIGSGLNRAMESFYIGDVPKKTMTIALEEVGVVKAGLIAAGIGILAVIMKKIYDWLKNFFGGSSGGGGGGGSGGGSSGSEVIEQVAAVAEPVKKLSTEVKSLPPVVLEVLANTVASDSPEAEKANSNSGNVVSLREYMAHPEEHVGSGVAIPKHQPSKADEAGIHIPTGEVKDHAPEIDAFYNDLRSKVKSGRVVFVSKSSRGAMGFTDTKCVEQYERLASYVRAKIVPRLEEFEKLVRDNGLTSALKMELAQQGAIDGTEDAKKAIAAAGKVKEFTHVFEGEIKNVIEMEDGIQPGERPADPTTYIKNVARLADSMVGIDKMKSGSALVSIVRASSTYETMIEGIKKKLTDNKVEMSDEARQKLIAIKETLEDVVKSFRNVGKLLAGLWKAAQKIARSITGLVYELRDVINQTTSRTTLTVEEVSAMEDIGRALRVIQVTLSSKSMLREALGRSMHTKKEKS